MFKKYAFVSIAAAAFAFAATVPATADGNLTLKAYQGYSFTRGSVTKSDDPNADVSFSLNSGHDITLGARKIKAFGDRMPSLSAFSDIKSWPSSVDAPEPGIYVVQGHDGRTVYLMRVTSVSSRSRAAEVDGSWEKLW